MNDSERSSSNPGSANTFLWDVSGAFGDLGVLLPLAVALIARNGMNPTAVFLMAGLFYILSAFYFKITMPVQPLKAMSAIAISSGVGFAVINAAGLLMGAILLLLTAAGLSEKLGSLFPTAVVRGIQLGLGLLLVKSSFGLIRTDVPVAALAASVVIAEFVLFRKIPPMIPLLLLAVVLAAARGMHMASFGYLPMRIALPDAALFQQGFVLLVLPQLALTFGNAVVATEATGKLLYGERARRLTLKSIPVSMGVANLLSGILGGAPMCHGCGGLTAHRTFGATSERSGYVIGAALIVLALVFGRSALSMIAAVPQALLGVLLFTVGVQHSFLVKDIVEDRQAFLTALAVASTALLTANLTTGFLFGLAMHYSIRFVKSAVQA